MRCIPLTLLTLLLAAVAGPAHAATLAPASYDNDSYVFFGSNNVASSGITTTTDFSGGVAYIGPDFQGHLTFGVIKFDLTGIDTVANGGPNKYLELDWIQNGAAEVAVSVAQADLEAGVYTFGPFFPQDGNEVARYDWYVDNIKGDDASFGGYAGGAPHVGVLSVNGAGAYSLDVTAEVDAWISGGATNYGFGLWAVSSTGGQGAPQDFASSEYAGAGGYQGPRLTDRPVPEPASLALVAAAVLCAVGIRSRRNG